MDYREATDRLMENGCTLRDLAQEIGVTRSTVQQARLPDDSASKRPPPKGWREAVRALAKRRGTALLEIAEEV